ncbi:MAG: methyltransferase domain-containing protein [Gemmatimonadaceae bacterium]
MTPSWLTPARRRGVEVLDDPAIPDHARDSAMRDVARSNRLFGGTSAVIHALESLGALGRPVVLLDIGTGTGDIAARLRGDVRTIGLDVSESLLRVARPRMDAVVAGSALALPFRDGAVDVVVCSQLLHHFEDSDAQRVVRELDRVTQRWVVVSDLRRSWFAAAGFWLASMLLRFHPITRHDGVVSVLRGFTSDDLRRLVRGATGRDARVRPRPLWRLTAVWENTGATRGD